MMKHKIKYVIALAFMLLLSQGTWADPAVTIIKQLNGEAVATTSPGEVTPVIENGKCILTVTPAYGYYVTSEYITAYSVVTGNVAQAPQRRSPNMDNDPITVTAIGDQSDPSGVTQYELTMPADGSDVEVTVNFQTTVMYDIYIGGVQVSQFNAADVLKDGHVSFDVESNTLTLNGATVATEAGNGIDSYIDELTIHLVGNSTMNHQIWMSNGAKKLKFTTSDETPGKLAFASDVTNPYEASGVSSWSNATYQNGLTLRRNADNAYIIALDMPTPNLANSTGKVFFPGATFALAIESDNAADFDIYYRIGTGEATKYTEPFTIEGTSNATIYAYSIYRQYATDADYKSNTHSFLIRRVDKPTFSPAGGTYDEEQTVKLENLPDNISANTYPQVWYYLGENETDSVQVTSAEQDIPVTESTKVCVYFIDEDSGKVYKSEAVQAEYTIRQEPGYHFSTSQTGDSYYSSGSTVYNLKYGEENTLPWLINVPQGMTITYASEDEDVATISETGAITLTGAGHVWLSASNEATEAYQAHTERIRLEIRPTDPQASLVEGAYFTGQKLTLIPTVGNGDIYYSYGDNGEETLYTENEEIELPKGVYEFYTRTRCVTEADNSETDYMESDGNSHRYYCVYDEPTISHASDTYNGTIEVEITNLPEEGLFPVTAYYYFDDDEDKAVAYTAGTKIPVEASKKLNVYLYVEGDSGKKYKTEVIERQYVIRQDAGLAFSAQTATYTLGGENNPDMPALQNENELDVTYESSDEDVATVDAETGEVTPVGVGITTITASSPQTATLQAGEASYMLTVKKKLAHESITVTVDDAIFTGEALEPEVTVMDGETDITEYVNVTYSNNVEPGEATVTITPNTQLETNFYVGETTQTFNISYRTLEIGKDVTFASGQTWASYYNVEESLNLPEGYMAYIVTAVSETAATVKAINYIPVDVPVFIEKDATVTTTENSSAEGNLLVGTTESTPVSSIPGVVYGLHNNKLMRVTSGSIPAWRAFIAPDYEGAVARELAIVFGDSTNGINGLTVNTDDDTANDSWYTLDGRRLQQKPAKKGLYIKNGQKFLVK